MNKQRREQEYAPEWRNWFLTLGICATVLGYAVWNGAREQNPKQKTVDSVVQAEQPASWKKYVLNDFPEYSALLPVMQKESERTGVSLEHLAIICLNESKGKGGARYEAGFQKRYIDNKFGGESNVYTKLREQLSVPVADFKKQLSTSTGPMQIMYATAVDLGFRGSFELLSQPEENVKWAAEYLAKKKVTNTSSLEAVLRIYNTGSEKGTPHQGYVERAKDFCKSLGVEYAK